VISGLYVVVPNWEEISRDVPTPPPTPPSFPLDFSQLLQATVPHPPSRPRIYTRPSVPGTAIPRERIEEVSKEEEEGWDLVDDDV